MSVNVEMIKNDDDLAVALQRLFALRESEEGTGEFEEWSILADLIEAYERRTIPMDVKVSGATFKEFIENWTFTEDDVARVLGDSEQAADLMSGRRLLNPSQMIKLHDKFQFPYDDLIRYADQSEQKAS